MEKVLGRPKASAVQICEREGIRWEDSVGFLGAARRGATDCEYGCVNRRPNALQGHWRPLGRCLGHVVALNEYEACGGFC